MLTVCAVTSIYTLHRCVQVYRFVCKSLCPLKYERMRVRAFFLPSAAVESHNAWLHSTLSTWSVYLISQSFPVYVAEKSARCLTANIEGPFRAFPLQIWLYTIIYFQSFSEWTFTVSFECSRSCFYQVTTL